MAQKNQQEDHELDTILEAARLRCVSRLRHSLDHGDEPDRLDILVVGQWRDNARRRNPKEIMRDYGPHWGVGGLGAAIILAAIQAAENILRH